MAVPPDDEFADDQDGDGEAEGGVAVSAAAVGVAAELAVVGQPAVGGFRDPAEPEPHRQWPIAVFGSPTALDHQVVESGVVELAADLGVVVAAVEMHCLDVGEQSGGGDVVEGGLQHADVVAVGAVDRPAWYRCHDQEVLLSVGGSS